MTTAYMTPNLAGVVPLELQQRPQWVCWKFIAHHPKPKKVPFNARTGSKAKPNDPSTWSSFDTAMAAWQSGDYDGIGFVFSAADPLFGVDLDACINADGVVVLPAQAIIDEFGTYTEVSPSGCGIKMVGRGVKPDWAGCRSKQIDGFRETEIYDRDRFFTITGNVLDGCSTTIEDCQTPLDALCERLWPPQQAAPHRPPPDGAGFTGDDAQLIEMAVNARNGEKFRRLWHGDVSLHGDDDSVADLALCSMLAFWTGCDPARIDQLFRQSGLYRDKWDRTDYRERTIAKAINGCSEVYHGHRECAAENLLLDGPLGVRLQGIEVRATPTRQTARFSVLIEGRDTGMEMTGSNTVSGLKGALEQVLDALKSGRPDVAVHDDDREQLRLWLAKVFTTSHLSAIERQLKQATEVTAQVPVSQASMYDIALAHMQANLQLMFIDPAGNLWSEQLGRMLTRTEFTNHVDPVLLDAIKIAGDYAKPTESDPTKPIKQLQQVLKPVWTALGQSLPTEVGATDIGGDSKAALQFRGIICRLWQAPETWMKFEAADGTPARVERMSLASRVRELVHPAGQREPRWDRVLKGINAFYRVERNDDHQPVVWLGMRADLCHGEIKGVQLPQVRDQHDLATLMNRYALADTTGMTDRLRDDGRQRRICVLSRALTDYLIDCVDEDPTEPSVTESHPLAVTQGQPDMRVDLNTGEVLA